MRRRSTREESSLSFHTKIFPWILHSRISCGHFLSPPRRSSILNPSGRSCPKEWSDPRSQLCVLTPTHIFTPRSACAGRPCSIKSLYFTPGYDQLFRRAGHAGAFLLPHAVRRELYDQPELQREFEIGWVGQWEGELYGNRANLLPKLFKTFHGNDPLRPYTIAEVAEVYRRSRIVVNIGRDDFPQDANLRVFEVLASGALLITSLPSELTEIGFQEGVHFIGYKNQSEIPPLVKQFLECEGDRIRIGQSGRAKVLSEHTYDNRAQVLLERLNDPVFNRLAPARGWPEHRARLAYLDYFASLGFGAMAHSAISAYRWARHSRNPRGCNAVKQSVGQGSTFKSAHLKAPLHSRPARCGQGVGATKEARFSSPGKFDNPDVRRQL